MPVKWGLLALERPVALEAEAWLTVKVKARANTATPIATRKIKGGIILRLTKSLLFSNAAHRA